MVKKIKGGFISTGDLLKKSFEVFKEKVGRFLGLWGITALGGVGYTIMLLLSIAIGLGLSVGLNLKEFGGVDQIMSNFNFASMGIMVLVVVVLTLLFIAFVAAVGIAQIILVADEKEIPLFDLIKKGFPLILPLIVTNFVAGLVSAGGMFLLFVPGVIISIMFSFVALEVVLEKKKFFKAMKASMIIISQNFGDIFIKYLVYFLGLIVIFSIFGSYSLVYRLSGDSSVTAILMPIQIILGILRFVLNIFLPFFSMIFGVLLYKEARSRTDFNKSGSFAWVYIVSALGYALAVAVMFILGAFMSGVMENVDMDELKEGIMEEISEGVETDFDYDMNVDADVNVEVDTDVNYDNYIYE